MNCFLGIIVAHLVVLINCQQSYYDSYWRMQSQRQQQNFLGPQQPYQHQFYSQQPQQFFNTRQTAEPINAIAKLEGTNVTGVVQFSQMPGTLNVQVSGHIIGLSPGLHGFHIHQFGDTRDGCKSMGGHFNPDGNNHGARTDQFRHAGDLGNIEANQNGISEFNLVDQRISLMGPYSILGRGLVVHANPDDLGRGNVEESRKTGNAGGRIACGIVALVK